MYDLMFSQLVNSLALLITFITDKFSLVVPLYFLLMFLHVNGQHQLIPTHLLTNIASSFHHILPSSSFINLIVIISTIINCCKSYVCFVGAGPRLLVSKVSKPFCPCQH